MQREDYCRVSGVGVPGAPARGELNHNAGPGQSSVGTTGRVLAAAAAAQRQLRTTKPGTPLISEPYHGASPTSSYRPG